MPFTTVPDKASGSVLTEQNWDVHLRDNLNFLKEVAYVEFTSDVSITATTDATANTVVSSGAITYEAVPHLIEFKARSIQTAAIANAVLTCTLWDGSTNLGWISRIITPAAGTGGVVTPYYDAVRIVPTAASHTYIWKAFVDASTGSIRAGAGGTGVSLPGFIRITHVPT